MADDAPHRPPRPEVVQALVSAWTGDPAALDDLTGSVTADERQTATALVAALSAVGGEQDGRRTAAMEYLAAQGLQDTPQQVLAREHQEAWRVYQRILLAVDELD